MALALQQNNGGGGGSSSPQLPVWTYVAGGGTPGVGQFTTDTADPATTAVLKFHTTAKGGLPFDDFLHGARFNTSMILVGTASGKMNSYYPLSNPVETTFVQMAVALQAQSEAAWSGDYSLGIYPSLSAVSSPGGVSVGNIPTFSNTDGDVEDGIAPSTLARLDSPDFINNPTAPTQTPGDNSTKLATTAYVDAAIAAALANSGTLTAILTAAGITPVTDGTVTPVTSITTATGVTTAIS